MAYPRMALVGQRLYGRELTNLSARLRSQLERSGLHLRVRPGASIAVTAGSRGIHDLVPILRGTVEFLHEAGAKPFVVPAMGSHGGATAEGQLQLLESLGVTEASVAAPIRSSMEVVRIAEADGAPVYMDRNAWESDGVVVLNRVKPHTDFRGPHESGIVKMIVIGLGKRQQPEYVHSYGTRGLRELIPTLARATLATGKIIGAIAVSENGYGRTADLVAVPPEEVLETDRRLLAAAKRHHPRLPFNEIDILVVDWLGKEISGAGMDTNVLGRLRIGTEPWMRSPRIGTIIVLDVTDASHGNAVGLGLADITTQRLIDRTDRHATLTNTIVSTFLERGFTPLVYPTDKDALDAAISLHRATPPEQLRVVRIRSTMHLERMWVSEALAANLPSNARLLAPPRPLEFAQDGRFPQDELYADTGEATTRCQ